MTAIQQRRRKHYLSSHLTEPFYCAYRKIPVKFWYLYYSQIIKICKAVSYTIKYTKTGFKKKNNLRWLWGEKNVSIFN